MARPRKRHLVQGIGRWAGRLVLVGFMVWALTLAGVVMAGAILSRPAPLPAPADAIICLGAGLSSTDRRLPDAASDRRAQACASLHAAGLAPIVIFTGYGHPGFSAAAAMERRALGLGLPPGASLLETEARSTIQNAAFSLPMLPEDTRRIILVSDAFHLPRAWVIFRAMGVENIALYPAPPSDGPGAGRTMREWVLRETLAVWFNAGRAAVYVAGGLIGIDRDTRIGWFN